MDAERASAGKHFGSTNAPSKSIERQVVRGASTARLLGFLEKHPIGDIGFESTIDFGDGPLNGLYNPHSRRILLSLNRTADSFGQTFKPGQIETVSAAAKSPLGAVVRTFVHELGHHLHHVGGLQVKQVILDHERFGRPISWRARKNWKEYFTEAHAAYVYHRKSLQEFDPEGYKMVVKVRTMLGVEP